MYPRSHASLRLHSARVTTLSVMQSFTLRMVAMVKCEGPHVSRTASSWANRGLLVASTTPANGLSFDFLRRPMSTCRECLSFFANLQVIDFFHFLDLVGLSAFLSTCSAYRLLFRGSSQCHRHQPEQSFLPALLKVIFAAAAIVSLAQLFQVVSEFSDDHDQSTGSNWSLFK